MLSLASQLAIIASMVITKLNHHTWTGSGGGDSEVHGDGAPPDSAASGTGDCVPLRGTE